MGVEYDLSSIGAIAASAELARARANQEPSQGSYNAGWLHGYADALADAAKQLEPQQQLSINSMGQEEFQTCITELLGEVDPAAAKNWLLYAKELDESGTESMGVLFDEICGELRVIRDSYGPDIARRLYNHGREFTFAPFELRTAAEHLKAGKPIEEVARLAVEGDFFTMPERYHKMKKEKSHER